MSFLVNPHQDNPSSLKPPTFTTSLAVGILVGGFAFASVALVPFRSFPALLQLLIVMFGPVELATVWVWSRYNPAMLETARYHSFGYAIGLAAGMCCMGIF